MGKFQLSFTLLIAYAVPGLLGVYSLSLHFEPINYLFGLDTAHSSTTVIIPLTLLVLGAGIIINALTWAFLRPLIHLFGVKKPDLDYSKLTKDKIEQYNIIVESSYRCYQSYSNLLTSILILLIAIFTSQDGISMKAIAPFCIVMLVLLAASRDSLLRSYERMSKLLI